ncbi:MAG: YeeE/YedE thiosulfate transporter family protein [Bradymonadia bacterium]
MGSVLTYIAILFLAVLFGWAAHGGHMCTVRSMGLLIQHRNPRVLVALMHVVLWSAAALMALWCTDVIPNPTVALDHGHVTWMALAGGLVFGVGAAWNKACAISLMARLGSGELVMLGTLAGFGTGVVAGGWLEMGWMGPDGMSPDPLVQGWLLPILLWHWCAWALFRLWRDGQIWRPTPREPESAAMWMGLSNAALIWVVGGPWISLMLVGWAARWAFGFETMHPPLTLALSFVGVLVGASWSAWRRGQFTLRLGGPWLRSMIAGLVMGFGAGMIPGGNDALMLHGLPMLMPQVALAFVMILVGVGLGLMMTRGR